MRDQEALRVVVECDMDSSPEKIWRALTIPALAQEWLGLGADAVQYEVLEALPHTRVRYSWRDETASQPDSIVTIELTPLPEGRTRFRLTHGVAETATLMAANTNRPRASAFAA